MSIDSGSFSGSNPSTIPNPLAQSLADLLQPWTDALSDLSMTASNNYKTCDASLKDFEGDCAALIDNADATWQGAGAQAFDKIYLLNVDQAGIINGKIQDFQKATHDLLTHIQNLNAQYELGKDGGIYWNAGPGNDPNSIVDSEFFSSTIGDNYIILSVLMDGFLTNTAIDDLLDPVTVDATIAAGTKIGVTQITRKIETSYQAQQKDPSPFLDSDHKSAIQTLQGFAANMNKQLQMWAEELSNLAEIYVQQVWDAGIIQELTLPLQPQSTAPSIPDPLDGKGATQGVSPTPTHATYLSLCPTATGLDFSPKDMSYSESNPPPMINTVYVRGTDLGQLHDILTELQGKVQGGSAVLANLLGGVVSGAGIAASFIPVVGEIFAATTTAITVASTAGGIGAALLGGASTTVHLGGTQKDTDASNAIGELIKAVSKIQSYVSSMTKEAQFQIGIMLTESDTYAESYGLPDEYGNPPQDLGPDYSSIATATFKLSYFTIQV